MTATRIPTRLVLALAGSLALGSACATPPSAPVVVVKSLGQRQCEGGGTAPAAMAQALQAAGVSVLAQACAHDGRMRPSMCGAPDGVMGWFQIPGDQLAKAQGLGFVAITSLPDARRQDCR